MYLILTGRPATLGILVALLNFSRSLLSLPVENFVVAILWTSVKVSNNLLNPVFLKGGNLHDDQVTHDGIVVFF